MKPHHFSHILLFLFSLSLLLQNPAQAQSDASKTQPQSQQSRLLMQLLKMEPAEIIELRRTLERIESMNPEEKQAFADKVKRLQAKPSETAKRLHQEFLYIPREEREAMHQRWRAMNPEERKAWRQRMNTLDPAQRLEQMKKEGVLPWYRYGNKPEKIPANTQKPKPIPLAPAPQTQDSPTPPSQN